MKTYIKPEVDTFIEIMPDQMLAVSSMNLFNEEGSHPFDAAPPFMHTNWF